MILLTGASGFLGQQILSHFEGPDPIITLGRHNCDIKCDLASQVPLNLPPLSLVIHCAGKAHFVPKTAQEKQSFFDTNVTGTLNLLKGIEASAIPDAFVFISTVAVYGKETGILINEDSELQAKDPYGLSKIEAERAVLNWCAKYGVKCTILRLPLIAGPNPPGNLKAMINGIKKGRYANIAGGKAKKSIVLASDVARIIPLISKIGGTFNLTDGYDPSFFELSTLIAKQLNERPPINIPRWAALLIAKIGDIAGNRAPINTDKFTKITSELTFDISKVKQLLGWQPALVLTSFKIQ